MSKLYQILWNPNIKAPVYHIVNTETGVCIAERDSYDTAQACINRLNDVLEVHC